MRVSPLGLAIAPNGDLFTVNAGDGNRVETTPQVKQVAAAVVGWIDNTAAPMAATKMKMPRVWRRRVLRVRGSIDSGA
jgi:hypothetical protein